MIYKHLSITPEEALPATCALELTALFNGANIIRAHDVKEAVQIVKLFNTLNTGKKDEHRNS
jgi:dihydropteroate synthase